MGGMASSGRVHRLGSAIFRRLKQRLPLPVAAVVMVDLFLLGVLTFSLVTGYQRDYDKTVAALDNLSRSMDDTLTRRADKIDLTLRTAVDEAERELASGGLDRATLDAFGARLDERVPEALGLAVWDARGQLVHASPKARVNTFNVSNREFFTRQRDEPTLGLFISAPFQGRMWPNPIIVLSRRYQAPDGSFAGIVSHAVSVDSLSSILFSAEALGPGTSVTLWDRKLGMVSQYTQSRFRLETGTRASPQLAALIERDAAPTVYHHVRADFGHAERIAFFRKVGSWPLYLSLGVFRDDALAKWRREALTLGGLGVLFLAASIWGLVLYMRYLNALRASEQRYKGLFDHMQVGLSLREAVFDEGGRPVDFRFLAANDAYLRLCKLSQEQVVGRTLREVFPYPEGRLPDWTAAYDHVVISGEPAHFEAYAELSGQWLDIVAYRTEPGRIAVLSIDISDHKAAEDRARRLSRLYAALSQCNQAIVHSANQEDLFPQVCHAAVEFGGMTAAWIGWIDQEAQCVKPAATYGIGPADLEQLQVSIAESGHFGQGPTGCAIRLDRPVWSDDIVRDGGFDPRWWEWPTGMGVASAAALPLHRRGNVVGNLTLYCDTPNAFDNEARKLMAEMASDISFALDNFAREAERRQSEARINDLAFFDQLTGLANRALLIDHLKQAIAGCLRSETFNALFFIDLDNFKTINDTLGHDRGDLLLQQVAQRLSSVVRAVDTLARFGGDEFVLLVQGLSRDETEAAADAETVCGKILAALDRPLQLDDAFYRCTASIGVTLFGNRVHSVDDLLKQADMAMYKAKGAGRNNARFFDPVMQSIILNRLALERDLAEAIRLEQFTLHYQPQIFGTDRVVGAEALIRWPHPTRGMVSPADFIPLAEENGQILAIGEWVLKTACAQLIAWAGRPEFADLSIAVNVSARQFREPNFVETVVKTVNETGVNPRMLKLELTESLMVVSVQEVIEKMTLLRERGLRFSLDDFGTGYSSMAYLKRLPLEQLKIDQSFIRDLLTDPNDAAIARAIVDLAHSLGLEVIAEGVETQEQQDFLIGLGCYMFQGYLFSRPLTADAFEAFVLGRFFAGVSPGGEDSPRFLSGETTDERRSPLIAAMRDSGG
ncbi:EAL domain-containing protein [Phaeospirillum tilakii]|uniref:EAL domain-containing protein n=1 Tax=Phaeospirillum tilakii TaxID=741673 RepID=A0ABW5C8P0_9PROT